MQKAQQNRCFLRGPKLPAVLTLPGKHDAKFNANVKGGQKTTLWAGDRGTSGDRGQGTGGDRGTSGDRGQGTGGDRRKEKPPACAGGIGNLNVNLAGAN